MLWATEDPTKGAGHENCWGLLSPKLLHSKLRSHIYLFLLPKSHGIKLTFRPQHVTIRPTYTVPKEFALK